MGEFLVTQYSVPQRIHKIKMLIQSKSQLRVDFSNLQIKLKGSDGYHGVFLALLTHISLIFISALES